MSSRRTPNKEEKQEKGRIINAWGVFRPLQNKNRNNEPGVDQTGGKPPEPPRGDGSGSRTQFWADAKKRYEREINSGSNPFVRLDIHFPIKFDLRASGYPPEKQLNPTGKMLLQEPNLKSATATLTEKWKQRWILIKWPSGANIQSKIYRVYTPAETEENTWWIRAVRPNGSFFPLVINKARMNDTIVNNHRVQFIFTVLGSGMAPRANRDPTEQHHIQG